MGIFQRQGLKYTLVNWLGILVSTLSTVFLFPLALEEYGLVRFLLDTTTLLFPLVSMGAIFISLRYFPYFEDKSAIHNGLLGLMLLLGLAGCLLFSVLVFLFRDAIQDWYGSKNELFQHYLWLLIPLLFLNTANSIFFRYAMNFKRIVIPSILVEVLPKITTMVLIGAYLMHWIGVNGIMVGLFGYMIISAIGFVFYIVQLQAWRLRIDLSFMPVQQRKEMWRYAIYGVLTGFAMLIISKLDSWLVGSLLDLRKGGVYAISSFIANVIEVPSKALVGIGATLVSKYWMEGNMAEMKSLYQKVSLNLLIMGLLLFGSFWLSVDVFFAVVKNASEMEAGKYVILVLGIAKLIDMATGLNNHLLLYSPKFRYSYLQITAPALISIGLGYIWTTQYGMMGAAWATFVSVTLYNGLGLFFNWYFFGLQPFRRSALWVIGLSVAVFGVAFVLPKMGTVILDGILRAGLYIVVLTFLILRLRLSDDFNILVNKFWPGAKF